MNSEIVAALEKYLKDDDLVWDAIDELRSEIEDLKQRGRDPNPD
jgi:hypothetical protein